MSLNAANANFELAFAASKSPSAPSSSAAELSATATESPLLKSSAESTTPLRRTVSPAMRFAADVTKKPAGTETELSLIHI